MEKKRPRSPWRGFQKSQAPAIYKALCAATTATGATPGSVPWLISPDETNSKRLEKQKMKSVFWRPACSERIYVIIVSGSVHI